MDKLTSILAIVEDSSAAGLLVVDKAAWLARQFGARLEVLAGDTKLLPELSTRCSTLPVDKVTIAYLLHAGEPLSRALLRHVHDHRPDLLVKVRSSDRADCRLARQCPAPVLLTGPTPWRELVRIAAAVDVADADAAREARATLQAAGFLALGCEGDLDVLYGEREKSDEPLRMERAVKLAQLVREFRVGCERMQMFDGPPEECLPRLITARRYDVLVVGLLPESLRARLAEATGGDVLLVSGVGRERRLVRERKNSVSNWPRDSSGLEQPLHQRQ